MHRLILLALAPLLLTGQPLAQNWDNIKRLPAGRQIEVVDQNMKTTSGKFTAVTDQEISLRAGNDAISIPRAAVVSVKDRTKPHRGRNTLIGLAAGAAAGLAIGAIKGGTYYESGETPVFVAVWTPIGAGIGAAAGALIPSSGSATIYRRPTPSTTSPTPSR